MPTSCRKFLLLTAASIAALPIGSGTASAQPQVLVPHRNHYHVVPACPTPVYGEYGFQNYSPGFYASPGDTPFGGDSSGFDTTSVVAADSGPASLAANGMHDPHAHGWYVHYHRHSFAAQRPPRRAGGGQLTRRGGRPRGRPPRKSGRAMRSLVDR